MWKIVESLLIYEIKSNMTFYPVSYAHAVDIETTRNGMYATGKPARNIRVSSAEEADKVRTKPSETLNSENTARQGDPLSEPMHKYMTCY